MKDRTYGGVGFGLALAALPAAVFVVPAFTGVTFAADALAGVAFAAAAFAVEAFAGVALAGAFLGVAFAGTAFEDAWLAAALAEGVRGQTVRPDIAMGDSRGEETGGDGRCVEGLQEVEFDGGGL